MSFRIFYNSDDLTAIQNILSNTAVLSISAVDKVTAAAILAGGLSSWATAPQGQPASDPFDADCKVVSIVTLSPVIAKQDMMDLLTRIAANNSSASYMLAIANDMLTSAAEP